MKLHLIAFWICTVAGGLVCGSVLAEEPSSPPKIKWESDVAAAVDAAKETQQPLLLFIKTDNCAYCTLMERETFADQKVAEKIAGKFVATTVSSRNAPALVRRLGVKLYPTTVIIAPDNRVLDSIEGYIPAPTMQTRLAKAASKIETTKR